MDELRAGLDLVQRFSRTYHLVAAFWLRFLDDERFFLCMASDEITSENRIEAREESFKISFELQSPFLDKMAVILVDPNEPVARRALELRQGHVGITRSTSNKVFYRGTPVEELYVYSEGHLALGVLI